MTARRGFGSDNHAGVLPDVLAAIGAANEGHAPSYGHDELTERVQQRFRDELGDHAHAFLVFNGSGANVLSLRAVLRPWEGAILAETAHLNVDEGGAPETLAGVKLLTVATPDGKLTPELVSTRIVRIGDEHAVQPRVVSITQSTELGTLYSLDEVRALADHAHSAGLLLHLDGARITNSAAALVVSLREATTDLGDDLMSFVGTKAGLLAGEAVVVTSDEAAAAMPYLRKQTLQLASKMRFIAAQFEALLEGERWREAAGHANAMAARLAAAVRDVPGVTITQEVQANAVFAILPPGVADTLRESWFFYDWDELRGEVRWMCSWDTTEADVDAFAADVATAAQRE
ncbi:MAG: Threonine aldolase [Solirubrobacteraceae bacterium]|nr:Threonine aldolase [Solirubrobacteraceae bacterium]